jgi:hypothetical protein
MAGERAQTAANAAAANWVKRSIVFVSIRFYFYIGFFSNSDISLWKYHFRMRKLAAPVVKCDNFAHLE